MMVGSPNASTGPVRHAATNTLSPTAYSFLFTVTREDSYVIGRLGPLNERG